MSYRLSKRADRDVLEIFLFGAERFGVHEAALYHTDLEQTFEMLGRHPRIAREQDFRQRVRIHTHRAHAIIYAIEVDDILIVRVLHVSQDWRSHL